MVLALKNKVSSTLDDIRHSSFDLEKIRQRQREEFLSFIQKSIPVPPSMRKMETATLFSVGCGSCLEAEPLLSHFKECHPILYAIDSNADALQTAKNIHQNNERMRYVQADARQLHMCDILPLQSDLVVFRRQELALDTNRWTAMIRSALSHITPEGTLLFTSTNYSNHQLLLQVLAELPCTVIQSGEVLGAENDSKTKKSSLCPDAYFAQATMQCE